MRDVKPKTILFIILFAAGMMGVLSFLTLDIEAVIALVPSAANEPMPMHPMLIKLLGLIQPSVLLAAAVVAGINLAPKLDLHAPAAEAAAYGREVWPALRPQILPGIVAGVFSAAALILMWAVGRNLVPPDFAARAEAFNRIAPAPLRLLYGGFTEELLIRWGLMTVLVWLPWRIFRNGDEPAPAKYFIGAIFVSAILFGAGHLGVAAAIAERLTVTIVLLVIAMNSLFAIIAGFLYWKRGLESAVIAHVTTHIGLIITLYLSS